MPRESAYVWPRIAVPLRKGRRNHHETACVTEQLSLPSAPPYPPDTRAKGWRFELAYEQIEQSDTWGLASALALEGLPLARPLLLALWYAAWKQAPCGSLPADDRLLAAALGIPGSILADYREVLLRGWWMADDGRLYHPTLTARVLEMMRKRRSDADRQSMRRAKDVHEQPGDSDGVTPKSRVTPPEVTPESSTGTSTSTSNTTPSLRSGEARKRATPPACPEGVDAQVWSDWLQLRKAKKAPVTATVIVGAAREADKAGISLEAFLRVWCARGSQGLQADWLKPHERAGPTETPHQRHMRERMAQFAPAAAVRPPEAPQKPQLAEVIDVTSRRLG